MNTKIELTNEEAALFIEFQKNHELFKLLVEAGTFNTKNGSIEIHFDSEGSIRNVTKRENVILKIVIPLLSKQK